MRQLIQFLFVQHVIDWRRVDQQTVSFDVIEQHIELIERQSSDPLSTSIAFVLQLLLPPIEYSWSDRSG